MEAAEQQAEGTEQVEQQEQQAEEEKAVPYDRFKEVNQQRKELADQLAELQGKVAKFEDANKSETERERAARERAESMVATLESKVVGLEKGSWVRSAAAELNFHDPEDAVAHLHDRLGNLEDAQDAKRAVKQLAKSKEHLIRQEKPEERRPVIGQVFGADTPKQQGQPQPMTPQQEAAQREIQSAQALAGKLGEFLDT